MRCHSEDVVVSWVGQLRAPAPRLSSNPVIEEKACRTGGPSRLLRVVSLDYSARALLWLAKRARDWVRLGNSACSCSSRGRAREQAYVQPLEWGLPTSSVCLDAGESACTGAKACVVSGAGTLVEAPPFVVGGRGSGRPSVWSIQRVPPRAGGWGVGVRRSEKWPRAGRRPIRQLRLWQPSRARSRALASVGRAAASRTIRPLFDP